MQKILTRNSKETKNLAKVLAGEIRGGEIICLSGDLGAGKTTFTQGLLEALGAEGPYTSPTFVVIKNYKGIFNSQFSIHKQIEINHIDAYRINEKDLLELGWQDFAGKKDCVTIIEWPERVKNLIPTEALWISFEWLSENEREITISKKLA